VLKLVNTLEGTVAVDWIKQSIYNVQVISKWLSASVDRRLSTVDCILFLSLNKAIKMSKRIAIIGGGNLGSAIAEGLLKSKFNKASEIIVTKRHTATLQSLKKKGVEVTDDNIEAVRKSDVVILAVKPFQVSDILIGIRNELQGKIFISVVTGVLISEMQETIQHQIPVFRAMPNTAIAIQQSMTCICNSNASAEDISYVNNLFKNLGEVVAIDEKLMEAATVLGACGIAYALRFIRANIQGGIEIGFDAATASIIAAQTVKGSAELLIQTGKHPEQEIDKVTTPKGCTIAGLNEMEHRGFSSSLIRGVVASYRTIAKD
jgi:pyrroline-5-carboxylate reductase